MNVYSELLHSDKTSVIYLGTDTEANTLLNTYAKDYDLNYLFINTKKITRHKKETIKKDLKLSKISNTVVIIDKGKVLDYFDDYHHEDKDKILTFLQDNDIVPELIGDAHKNIDMFNESLVADTPTIIYLVNEKEEEYVKYGELLADFCNDYSLNYVLVEGYYLTDNQKLLLLNKANYTELHDIVVMIVDEGNIKFTTEKIDLSMNDYFKMASSYGIIDESSSASLIDLKYDKIKDIVNRDTKTVILFSENNNEYSDRMKPIIGKIGLQNNIEIYHHLVVNNQKELTDYLASIGYQEPALTLPVIIVFEKGKVLSYAIGLTDKNLLETRFKELGVIR